MLTFREVVGVRQEVRRLKAQGLRIGLVPTMGALHRGHLSLIETAADNCDRVFVSIFVNPTQFNDRSDFTAYPRNEDADLEQLREHSVHAVFLPAVESVYAAPAQGSCRVSPGPLAAGLEGLHRPGHFEGVATVVSILFNMLEPDAAVFGEKDFQQLRVIEQLVSDLHFPVEIIRGATVREADGLALSSRNSRLSPAGRRAAAALSLALRTMAAEFAAGVRSAADLTAAGRGILDGEEDVELEYLELAIEETLQPVQTVCDPARALLAAWVDGVRLIDNWRLAQEG